MPYKEGREGMETLEQQAYGLYQGESVDKADMRERGMIRAALRRMEAGTYAPAAPRRGRERKRF